MTTVTQWFANVLPVRAGFYQRDWNDCDEGDWQESLTIVPDYFDGKCWHYGKLNNKGVLVADGKAINNRRWRGLARKPK